MTKPNYETKMTTILARAGFENSVEDSYLIKMYRWHYYTDRGSLLFVEGLPKYGEKDEDIFEKCERADRGEKVEDCPKHFSITGRPLDLLRFAKQILSFYTGYEKVHY